MVVALHLNFVSALQTFSFKTNTNEFKNRVDIFSEMQLYLSGKFDFLVLCYSEVGFGMMRLEVCTCRLLRAVVLAVLHVFTGECDGRVPRRSVALPHEAVCLLLYPYLRPVPSQPVSVRHEIETASPVRHRGI